MPVSRCLFVGLDYGGTWKPALGLARMMVGRGHAVTVLGASRMGPDCEAAGCAFISLPADFDHGPRVAVEDDWDGYDEKVCGSVLASALAPAVAASAADVLVIDCLLLNALSAAELVDAPTAIFLHWLMYDHIVEHPTDFDDWEVRTNRTRVGLGLDELPLGKGIRELWSRHEVVLSLPPPAWHRTELPSMVRHVGPIANEPQHDAVWDLPWPPDAELPLILISLSSTYMHQESALQRLAEAAAGLDANIVVSLAGAISPEWVTLPERVEVRKWVNFELLLPHTALVVTHGGQATVSAAMTYGVPILVSPLGRDQSDVAERVTQHGLGIAVDDKASVEEIRTVMRRLLDEEHYREAATRASAELRALGNGRIAIETLEALAKR